MINQLKREVCGDCNKSILIGQRFLECHSCQKIIHKNCFKTSNFLLQSSHYVCIDCANTKRNLYNPFEELTSCAGAPEHDSDCDKFYAEDFLEVSSSVKKASETLNNCSYYKMKSPELAEFNKNEFCDFKTMFYNIDGNHSNFDTFCTELQTQKTTYSAIALAETNTSKDKADLYRKTQFIFTTITIKIYVILNFDIIRIRFVFS